MNLYEIKYLRDDKKDPSKQISVSECYVSDSFDLVFKKASEHAKQVDCELISIHQYNPVLGVLKEKTQK